jgi:hypothetical protein
MVWRCVCIVVVVGEGLLILYIVSVQMSGMFPVGIYVCLECVVSYSCRRVVIFVWGMQSLFGIVVRGRLRNTCAEPSGWEWFAS